MDEPRSNKSLYEMFCRQTNGTLKPKILERQTHKITQSEESLAKIQAWYWGTSCKNNCCTNTGRETRYVVSDAHLKTTTYLPLMILPSPPFGKKTPVTHPACSRSAITRLKHKDVTIKSLLHETRYIMIGSCTNVLYRWHGIFGGDVV